MMEYDEDVPIATAIESLEQTGYPSQLLLVGRNVRIQQDEERVAVPERKRRVAVEAVRRTVRRDEFFHRAQRIAQPVLALRIADGPQGQVVIARRKEKRKTPLECKPLDDGHVADVPHGAVRPVEHRVAR